MFHLVGHHPFVDGNKRIGAVSALVFLDLNGYVTEAEPGELYELTIAAARGETNKHEIAEWFRKHSRQIDDDSGVDCRSDSL